MGDMSHEPSMEEILSSIKKIISEDSGKPLGASARRNASVELQAVSADSDVADLDVLELTEAVQEAEAGPELSPAILSQESAVPAPLLQSKRAQSVQPAAAALPTPAPVEKPIVNEQTIPQEETLVSATSVAASRNAFAQISRAKAKSQEADGEPNPIEALVADLLRPMLKEWLDANLPRVVEKMVAKEIARLRDD